MNLFNDTGIDMPLFVFIIVATMRWSCDVVTIERTDSEKLEIVFNKHPINPGILYVIIYILFSNVFLIMS